MAKFTGFQQICRFLKIPKRNEKGQSLIVIAFAFVGLLAMLGLALDLGLVYIERTRIKRAVDAAVLAGVVELPNEEQAFIRAIDYLDQNGYRLQDNNGNYKINMWIRGCSHDEYLDESDSSMSNQGTDGLTRPDQEYTSNGHLYYPPGGVPVANPAAEFILNTRSFQSTDGSGDFLPDDELCNNTTVTPPLLGTANKLHITGIVPVRMNFMQFFGFSQVPVSDDAVAQNVTQLDVAVVFDISGSMQYDTVCHGCYEQYGDGNRNIHPELPWQNLDYGFEYPILEDVSDYPNTFIHPIPTDHLPRDAFDGSNNGGIGTDEAGEAAGGLCYGPSNYGNDVGYGTITLSGQPPQYFIVIEAELYTRNNSIYETSFRQPGVGYWALQHSTYRTVDRMFSSSPNNDQFLTGATPVLPGEYDRGSWVSHHPFMPESREQIGEPGEPGYEPAVPYGVNYGLNEARANSSPSLDYEFITKADEGDGGWDARDDTTNEGTHIYARLQGGDVYWAVYDNAAGGPGFDPFDPAPLGSGDIERDTEGSAGDPQYGGAQASQWRWIELTGDNSSALNLEPGRKYTLRLWAGQAGLDIDQIVIANTTDRTQIFDAGYSNGATYPDNDKLHATAGSAFGQACNRCNPIYGQVIDDPADCLPPIDNGASQAGSRYYDPDTGRYDMRKDEIFGGYQPIRLTKEALKRFIGKLNPQFDQVGIVGYSSDTSQDQTEHLQCLRAETATNCYGASAITYTKVLNLLEKYPARGSTNIAQAMRDALFLLGVQVDGQPKPSEVPDPPGSCTGFSCARGASAKRVMVLMTDGVANVYPPGSGCDADPTLFQPDLDTMGGSAGNDNLNRSRDCVIYYANIAAEENIIIYTIGLGNGADVKLLEQVAEIGAGQYFAAQTPAKLNEIFDIILKSISVRLIQ